MRYYIGRRIGNSKWYGGVSVNKKLKPAGESTPFRYGFKLGLGLVAFFVGMFLWKVLLILGLGFLSYLIAPQRRGRQILIGR